MRQTHRLTLMPKSTNTYIIDDEVRKPIRDALELKLLVCHNYCFAIFRNLLSLMGYSFVAHISPLLSSYSP